MDRKAFRHLLKRYLDNSCTDDEKRIIDHWYELLDKEHTALSDSEIAEIEERLWSKIQSTAITDISGEPLKKNRISWWKYAAAAVLIGIVALTVMGVSRNKKQILANESLIALKVKEGFLQEANNSDTVKKIKLEDGSCVMMYPGSKLAFPDHFALHKREVYLEGDAFFTVSKNENRPFFVYNNQIVTQVLGTSFGIHKKNDQVEVAVKTGRVAVYENKDQIDLTEVQRKSNGVIITPNQKVTYYQHERHFVTALVDQPVPVPKESGSEIAETRFNYKETPLSKVFEDLEKTYELEIFLENKKIETCLFTGDLSGQTLFNKLESICLVFNATYEIKGTKILLNGGKECT